MLGIGKKEVGLLVAAGAIVTIHPNTINTTIKAIYNFTPETGISSAICSGLGSVLSYAGTGIYNAASACFNHTSTLLTSHDSYEAIVAHMAGAAFSFYVGGSILVSTLTTSKELDTRIRYLADLNNQITRRAPAHYSLNNTNALLARARNDAEYSTYALVASTLTMAAPLSLPALPAAIIVGAGIAASVYYNGIVRDMTNKTITRYSEIVPGAQNLGIDV
jgi:hypothetical protein